MTDHWPEALQILRDHLATLRGGDAHRFDLIDRRLTAIEAEQVIQATAIRQLFDRAQGFT